MHKISNQSLLNHSFSSDSVETETLSGIIELHQCNESNHSVSPSNGKAISPLYLTIALTKTRKNNMTR